MAIKFILQAEVLVCSGAVLALQGLAAHVCLGGWVNEFTRSPAFADWLDQFLQPFMLQQSKPPPPALDAEGQEWRFR